MLQFSEAVELNWKGAINECCDEIKKRIKLSLEVIKPELIRKGSQFTNSKFKEHFLQKANLR